MKGEDIYREVSLTLQNIERCSGVNITSQFLDLGSADIILGMQWLESLGGHASKLEDALNGIEISIFKWEECW